MSYPLMDQIRCSALPPAERVVAMTLASYAKLDGSSSYPGLVRLVRETGLSRRTVYRALRALARRGVITVATPHGPYRPTHYQIHVQALPRVGEAKQLRLSFPQDRAIVRNQIERFPQGRTGLHRAKVPIWH